MKNLIKMVFKIQQLNRNRKLFLKMKMKYKPNKNKNLIIASNKIKI